MMPTLPIDASEAVGRGQSLARTRRDEGAHLTNFSKRAALTIAFLSLAHCGSSSSGNDDGGSPGDGAAKDVGTSDARAEAGDSGGGCGGRGYACDPNGTPCCLPFQCVPGFTPLDGAPPAPECL